MARTQGQFQEIPLTYQGGRGGHDGLLPTQSARKRTCIFLRELPNGDCIRNEVLEGHWYTTKTSNFPSTGQNFDVLPMQSWGHLMSLFRYKEYLPANSSFLKVYFLKSVSIFKPFAYL